MARLQELVRVLRSKNAGPFSITFDVLFRDEAAYHRARDSGRFTAAALAPVLRFPEEKIRVVYYPPAHAIKIAVPRRHSSGAFDDTDIFGCQQHAPLLDLDIP